MKRIFCLLLFLLIYNILFAQTWQDTVLSIDKIFDRYQSDHPGCQLAISRNGKVIYSRAWGLADMEHHFAMSNSSIIEAGSVSKQFTAAAILLLEQQGKLSLNDDVHQYIPELPDYGTQVTLRQMMQHTSGLKDCWAVMALSDWPRGTKTYSNKDILHLMARQPTLNHKPGDEYLYSNSNYILLAIVAERVSGKSLPAFTRTHIFEPAGMKHTQWRDDLKKKIPNRAIAYANNNGSYVIDIPNETVYGSGGLLTTAEDLLHWNNFYLSGKLGNPSLLSKQLGTSPLNNGRKNNYAAGLRIDTIRGWKAIIHDGATAGYRSSLEYYPALGLSIAWLANTSEFDGKPDGTAELRALLLKNVAIERKLKMPENNATVNGKTFAIDSQTLTDYTGGYSSDEVEAILTISLTNGKLTIHRNGQLNYDLIPTDKDAFQIANSKVTVTFERDTQNRISHLSFTTNRVRNVVYKKD